MNLVEKLDLIEYIYEEISPNLFLYKLSETDPFILIDKTSGNRTEYSTFVLLNKLENQQVKLNLILDSILTQQALFHKMVLNEHLELLGMTLPELQQAENDLKSALKDITKGYVKKRLYIVETE